MLEGLSKLVAGRKTGSAAPLSKARASALKLSVSGSHNPGKIVDRMMGCRYELKYRISESKAQAIVQFIEPHLPLDHYSRLQPTGAYPIVTLYLDSHDFQLCRQTLEGQKNRFKLRVRSYTDKLDYPRFFEIKRRMNAIVIKSRARVMHQDVSALLRGWSLPRQEYRTDQDTLSQFQLYMKSLNARPVILVRYVRRAYEGDSENRVRVTFDRQLECKLTSLPEVTFDREDWRQHHLNAVILEVKFTGRYPIWLSRMIKCFDLRRQSFSKYVNSLKKSSSLGLAKPTVSV
jgi:SPX domain protein involved in polyphosphate accumulation